MKLFPCGRRFFPQACSLDLETDPPTLSISSSSSCTFPFEQTLSSIETSPKSSSPFLSAHPPEGVNFAAYVCKTNNPPLIFSKAFTQGSLIIGKCRPLIIAKFVPELLLFQVFLFPLDGFPLRKSSRDTPSKLSRGIFKMILGLVLKSGVAVFFLLSSSRGFILERPSFCTTTPGSQFSPHLGRRKKT